MLRLPAAEVAAEGYSTALVLQAKFEVSVLARLHDMYWLPRC